MPTGSTARSVSPRSRSRSPKGRSPSETRSYIRGISRSRSYSPERESSRSPRRAGRRWPRDRSYTRSPSPQSPQRSSKIVVEKLTKNVTEGHLHDIFGTFGEIQSIDLPLNRTFMTNRGTAYILYHDAADAEVAVSNMHDAQVDGVVLKVSIVLPRRAFSRTPPPARRLAAEDRSFSPRRHPQNHERHLPGSSRVSPLRRRSPRRHINGGASERHDIYRPRSLSRSPSPRRSRAHSYSVHSNSGSPPRRRSITGRHSRHRRRRSPSYGSYSSLSDESRSPSRSRGQRSNNRWR